jgi:hypothetical protein
MNVRRFAVVALAATSLAVPVGACSGDATTTTTTTTSTPAKNFRVSTPEGQVSLSLDGELPPGWPTDFPVPDGAEPAGSGSIGDAVSTARVGVFTTTESGEATLEFYTDNADVQTDNASAAGSGDRFVGSLDLDSPYEGTLTALSRAGATYLVVVLNESTRGSSSTTTNG